MIRSMLYSDPDEACTPCEHPDCRLAGCEGNRLYVESTSPLWFRKKRPHHQNDNKWKRALIDFIVPEDLAELLYMYLEGPRRKLMCSTSDSVFLDLQGRPFDVSASFLLLLAALLGQSWCTRSEPQHLQTDLCG